MNDLDRVKVDFRIDSFEKLTNDQMMALLNAHLKGKISTAQLEQIASMAPHFASIAKSVADGLAQTAASAASSQQVALAEVGKNRDAIVALANHPSATADTLKLIIEKLSELTAQIERMNGSNNSLFGTFKTVFAVLGVAFVGVIGAAIASEGGNKA